MRHLMTVLLMLVLGGASAAQAETIPLKMIRIHNNSPVTLYPIIYIGISPLDNWLIAQFGATDNAYTFANTKIYRTYVNDDKGIAPNDYAVVTVPFYSKLVANPDGRLPNQYIDWWNGGRIFFYDDAGQIKTDYANDSKSPVNNLVSPGPCFTSSWEKTCVPMKVFSSAVGLPDPDRSQLMEYTFADAITANGKPYPIKLTQVGYNISSVDQVYLPVAMQPLNNKLVPYIGTVESLTDFRAGMTAFLRDFPGWPVYNPVAPSTPRIPGAYNIFANAFTNPPNNVLSPIGKSVNDMINLYRTCISAQANKPAICDPYQQVLALFTKNYNDFIALPCHDPKETNTETEILKKLYGWVSFNEGCGEKANDLVATLGKAKFDQLQAMYIDLMQYSTPGTFNPYVSLIHSTKYLDMAAYSFSVDDAIGFQSYKGDGLIITFAGSKGLDNNTKLDKSKRVVVSLQVHNIGVPEWASIGICSQEADFGDVDPLHPSFEFYPPSYPCTFTATDLKGKKYQLVLQSGPPNLAFNCVGVADPAWCGGAQIVTINGQRNYINALAPNGDPPTSTHDFNGDGKSDIAWRSVNGDVAIWLMNGGQVLSSGTLGNIPTTWSIVGQRDFNADGKSDLLWRNSNGDLAVWLMNGAAVISSLSVANVPTSWSVAGTGDFNNDGRGDILWRNSNGDVAVWLMDGGRAIATGDIEIIPTNWSIVGTGDFNGDGKTDVLWRDTNGNMAVWFMNGVTVLSSMQLPNVPTVWTVVGTGDFNGDGKGDILWRDTNGNVAIWLMNGNQVAANVFVANVPTTWSVAVTGDYNFDGKSDILWRDTSGNVALWLMNGGQVASSLFVQNVPIAWAIQGAGAD